MANGRKEVVIDFSDVSGGKNNSRPQNAIAKNQVYDCLNVILEQRGYTRAPGLLGIDTEAALPSYCRLFDFYKKSISTESLYTVSNSILSLEDPANGNLTSKYSLASDAEAYGANFKGKYFFTCGADLVKVESSDTAYKVGIVAPTGVAAAAVAGSGTLTAGVYTLYAAYARKVSGTIVLYSYPQTIGNVTISGTQEIQITSFANSSDAQVGTKVIFAIEPSGTAAYFYYETGNNTTTSFNIASNAAKSISIIMNVVSVANYPIPQFDGICFHDNRMIGWYGEKMYYSIKAGEVYNVERFPLENIRELPHTIISCFSLNGLLCVNTIGGIYTIDGDLASKYTKAEGYLYFLHQRQHEEYKGLMWGVTNDGVRYFDGKSFSIDLSKDIKPDIDKIANALSANYYPILKIYRREGKRTELQISYRDTTISSVNNTHRLVLNIDSLTIIDALNYKIAWESWSGGVNFMTVSRDGTLYMAQNRDGLGAQILKESGWADRYVYSTTGTFLTSLTPKECYITTHAEVSDIMAMTQFDAVYILSLMNAQATLRFAMLDNSGFNYDHLAQRSGGAVLVFGTGILFPATFPAQNPISEHVKLPGGKSKGKLVFLKISQTSDDSTFNVFEIILHGMKEYSNQS